MIRLDLVLNAQKRSYAPRNMMNKKITSNDLYNKSHLGRRDLAYDGRKSLYTAGPSPFIPNAASRSFHLTLHVSLKLATSTVSTSYEASDTFSSSFKYSQIPKCTLAVNVNKEGLQVNDPTIQQHKLPVLQGKLILLHLKITPRLRQLVRSLSES